MCYYNEAARIAKKLIRSLNNDGHSCHNSRDVVDVKIEWFELKGLCEAYLSIEKQHKQIKRLFKVCESITEREDSDGYWTDF